MTLTNLSRIAATAVFVAAVLMIQAQTRGIVPEPPDFEKTKATVLQLLVDEQSSNVKESVDQYNCFTDKDLEEFHRTNVAETIVVKLKSDPRFVAMARNVGLLEPDQRGLIYDAGRKTYKKTWAQLHKIGPEGQTEAGQKAEKEIAEKIVLLLQSTVEDRGRQP